MRLSQHLGMNGPMRSSSSGETKSSVSRWKLLDEPLSKVPEPTAELPPELELLVVVVLPEDDFLEPHPAASSANAAIAASSTA